jgi:hypothetical protein
MLLFGLALSKVDLNVVLLSVKSLKVLLSCLVDRSSELFNISGEGLCHKNRLDSWELPENLLEQESLVKAETFNIIQSDVVKFTLFAANHIVISEEPIVRVSLDNFQTFLNEVRSFLDFLVCGVVLKLHELVRDIVIVSQISDSPFSLLHKIDFSDIVLLRDNESVLFISHEKSWVKTETNGIQKSVVKLLSSFEESFIKRSLEQVFVKVFSHNVGLSSFGDKFKVFHLAKQDFSSIFLPVVSKVFKDLFS